MKYGAFLSALRKPPLKQVFLLAGAESFFIEKAKNRILALINDNNALTVFENTANLENIISAINTAPLFSEKTVVLIKDSAIFKEKKTDSKTDSKIKDKELDKFIKVLSKMPGDSYIIFILNEKPDKRRKLYKAVLEAGLVLDAETLYPSDIGEWLTDKLTAINKTLDKEAYIFFNNMINLMKEVNLSYLDKEFDKLALYTDEKKIDRKTIEDAFSSVPEVSAFALLDAINEKNIQKALYLLRREIEGGAFLPLVIGLISRHIRQLLQVKMLLKSGLRGKNLAASLGVKPFIAEKVAHSSNLFDEKLLTDAMILLSDADYLIKTGQGSVELLEEILILLCEKKKGS